MALDTSILPYDTAITVLSTQTHRCLFLSRNYDFCHMKRQLDGPAHNEVFLQISSISSNKQGPIELG